MAPEDTSGEVGYEAPFAALLDMVPGRSSDGVGSASMTIQDKHRQSAGVVQGGIIVALADYAFFRAVQSLLEPGQEAVTLELKVNFLAPARDGELTATSRIVRSGRRVIVGDMEVADLNGTLIAKGLGTYLMVGQPT